ncbi:hypothetical protein DM02DRAFT_652411 [Periconia macrospinosa]|uniref:Uncharacterized protein n=1 Tax=Periconia macrospinosa TaxID=97972 RepID=A0A2V1DZZ4_9PLEO|nr:hypothetical protein DM02DRAFT_652411 [Periconia macrospinosa]
MPEYNTDTNYPTGYPNEPTGFTRNPDPPAHPVTGQQQEQPPTTTKTSSSYQTGVWGTGPTSWEGTYTAPPPKPPSIPTVTWTSEYPQGLSNTSYTPPRGNNSRSQYWFQSQQSAGYPQPHHPYMGSNSQPQYGQYANQAQNTPLTNTFLSPASYNNPETNMTYNNVSSSPGPQQKSIEMEGSNPPKPQKHVRFAGDERSGS